MRYRGLSRRRRPRTIGSRTASLLSVGLSSLLLISHIYPFNSATTQAAGPPPCLTVSASGTAWQNLAFVSAQTGTFTAEMDATPLGADIDAGVALSNGAQTAFTGLACIARFNTSGASPLRG